MPKLINQKLAVLSLLYKTKHRKIITLLNKLFSNFIVWPLLLIKLLFFTF